MPTYYTDLSRLGWDVVVADLNGDGISDVCVSAPQHAGGLVRVGHRTEVVDGGEVRCALL